MTIITRQQQAYAELIDKLELLRQEAEKIADSPVAGSEQASTYFLGKESAFREAISLVKRASLQDITHQGNPWVEAARHLVALEQKTGTPTP